MSPVPPMGGDTGAYRVGQLCLGINVPCGHICLHVGIIVRGTMVPRNECPGDSGA